MNWINVNIEFPECNIQHEYIFESDTVLTIDDIQEYHLEKRVQEFDKDFKFIKGYWMNGTNVVCWTYITYPTKKSFNVDSLSDEELKQAKLASNIDPKYSGIPNINFSLLDKNDEREKMFQKQRIERGFDDSELWSLNDTIAKFIIPRLKRFKKINCCYPYNIAEDKWNKQLSKIIMALELIIRDNGSWNFTKEETKNVDKGMNLFRKVFFNLWF